jgi:hypothetical protein
MKHNFQIDDEAALRLKNPGATHHSIESSALRHLTPTSSHLARP